MKKLNQATVVPETKRKLVDAGVNLMRKQGFNATTVDDICAEAGVTKGGFFHYFKSKEDLAKASLTTFGDGKTAEYQAAPFRKLADPLDRVFGRLDFVVQAVGGAGRLTKGCLIGMFAQELSFTNPALRGACQELFVRVARDFENDLTAAKLLHAPTAAFNPAHVAMLYVSILQGSLILAKAAGGNAVLADNIEQFRHYLESLFSPISCANLGPSAPDFDKSRN